LLVDKKFVEGISFNSKFQEFRGLNEDALGL